MQRYNPLVRLGTGSYGDVWKCADKETGQLVAIKAFNKSNKDREVMRAALREVKYLHMLKHPYLVRLLNAYKSDSGRIYVVLEHAEQTLSDVLKRSRREAWGPGLPPDLARRLMFQLLLAVDHMHGCKVMHRDLKPANVLLTADMDARLCDLGMACQPSKQEVMTSYVMTRWYRAPEVLVGERYGMPADIWSLGCLFYELLLGRPLLPGSSHLDQVHQTSALLGGLVPRHLERVRARAPEVAQGLEEEAGTQGGRGTLEERCAGLDPADVQVLLNCLQAEPAQRLTAQQLLQLPCFQAYRQAYEEQQAAQPQPQPQPQILQPQASPAGLSPRAARRSQQQQLEGNGTGAVAGEGVMRSSSNGSSKPFSDSAAVAALSGGLAMGYGSVSSRAALSGGTATGSEDCGGGIAAVLGLDGGLSRQQQVLQRLQGALQQQEESRAMAEATAVAGQPAGASSNHARQNLASRLMHLSSSRAQPSGQPQAAAQGGAPAAVPSPTSSCLMHTGGVEDSLPLGMSLHSITPADSQPGSLQDASGLGPNEGHGAGGAAGWQQLGPQPQRQPSLSQHGGGGFNSGSASSRMLAMQASMLAALPAPASVRRTSALSVGVPDSPGRESGRSTGPCTPGMPPVGLCSSMGSEGLQFFYDQWDSDDDDDEGGQRTSSSAQPPSWEGIALEAKSTSLHGTLGGAPGSSSSLGRGGYPRSQPVVTLSRHAMPSPSKPLHSTRINRLSSRSRLIMESGCASSGSGGGAAGHTVGSTNSLPSISLPSITSAGGGGGGSRSLGGPRAPGTPAGGGGALSGSPPSVHASLELGQRRQTPCTALTPRRSLAANPHVDFRLPSDSGGGSVSEHGGTMGAGDAPRPHPSGRYMSSALSSSGKRLPCNSVGSTGLHPHTADCVAEHSEGHPELPGGRRHTTASVPGGSSFRHHPNQHLQQQEPLAPGLLVHHASSGNLDDLVHRAGSAHLGAEPPGADGGALMGLPTAPSEAAGAARGSRDPSPDGGRHGGLRRNWSHGLIGGGGSGSGSARGLTLGSQPQATAGAGSAAGTPRMMSPHPPVAGRLSGQGSGGVPQTAVVRLLGRHLSNGSSSDVDSAGSSVRSRSYSGAMLAAVAAAPGGNSMTGAGNSLTGGSENSGRSGGRLAHPRTAQLHAERQALAQGGWQFVNQAAAAAHGAPAGGASSSDGSALQHYQYERHSLQPQLSHLGQPRHPSRRPSADGSVAASSVDGGGGGSTFGSDSAPHHVVASAAGLQGQLLTSKGKRVFQRLARLLDKGGSKSEQQ